MEIIEMPKSTSTVALMAIVVIVVAAFLVYAGVTYPRTTASISESFGIGVDSKTIPFDQQLLDNKVQVQITVQNGAALWRAQILDGNQVIWEHSAAQRRTTKLQ
jgi:hypothetical protein